MSSGILGGVTPLEADGTLRRQATAAMRKAATYYRNDVASHGGYVYHYSLDLKTRWGEGEATRDQIWVQPPGTPTVGMAFLQAFQATNDRFYLDAAQEAAEAIVYGQLKSGGWTNCIDFDPRGRRSALYRNGKGRGKNNSSLDDGQTQSAILLLIHVDEALGFRHDEIHAAAEVALKALLAAQFPNGGFPQVWTGPVGKQPVVKAGYPRHDWRTEGRIKNYWDMYTLNDDIPGYVSQTLIDAQRIYHNEMFTESLKRLGDFLLLAQMPEPQPGWAQQYNYEMQPIWARKFEPAAIAGDETQEAIGTLLRIYRVTKDRKYLEPIPRALSYLKRSLLPDGQLARFYELQTNRPLYMVRREGGYTLTYDDSQLPAHYGWKVDSRVEELERAYHQPEAPEAINAVQAADVRRIIDDLDSRGRWISVYDGERLVGQPKFTPHSQYLSSAVFSENLQALAAYIASTR